MGVNVTEPGSPLKQTWPTLSTAVLSPFTWVDTWLMINIVIVSQIFWPGEPLRVSEMGLLAGTAILSEGVFALLFGLLADRYSRKKIMMIATLLHGCLFALQGLMPAGLGNVSFYVFLGLNLARSAVFGYRQPLETSYTDDVVHEEKRSMYFGTSMLLERLGSIAGAIIATSIFVQGWRYYFFFVGGVMATVGVFIGLKAREPKRGSMRKELKSILSVGNASYDYQLKMDTDELIKQTKIPGAQADDTPSPEVEMLAEKILAVYEKQEILNGGLMQFSKLKILLKEEAGEYQESKFQATLEVVKSMGMISRIVALPGTDEKLVLFKDIPLDPDELRAIQFAIGKPVCDLTKDSIGRALGFDEERVLSLLKGLQDKGIIRITGKDAVQIPGIIQG